MKDLTVDSWKTPVIPEVNIDSRERKWGILNTMKVSYKHSESIYCKASNKCWYPLNTIEGIRIMMILAIGLSLMCQIQDWIYLVVQLKFQRFMIWKSTKKNYKYSNSSISLIHYLEDIEYYNLFTPIILWKDLLP